MNSGSAFWNGKSRRLRFAAVGLGIAVLVAGSAAACGSDSKKTATPSAAAATAAPTKPSADIQALRQPVISAFERWNAKDIDGFMAFFTEKGLISSFGEPGQSIDEARAGLKQFFATQPLKNPKFSQESIAGDAGTMDAVFQLGPTLLHSRFTLAKAGAAWKLDGEESDLPVDVPAGVATINVDLNEFAFGVDPSTIAEAKGQFALVANNVGKQEHELGLARIPDNSTVSDLVQQLKDSGPNAEPPGVTFIAGTGAKPGEKSNLVFAEPLAAGHYVMICFRPDTTEGPNGTPHAVKGMVRDFTVK